MNGQVEGAVPVVRPAVTELRMSAFKSFRGVRLGLGALTVLVGPSGAGKSNVLEALALLGRLAHGDRIGAALRGIRGGARACVPFGAVPDGQGRRGFRLGCTVDGPVGPVRLDVAVQTEPRLRIVGERLTGAGEVLLETALRDPERSAVQAAWHTAGLVPVTRAPLPDDRLATALLPLRVAGKTSGQRLVIAGAEQLVVGLRGLFALAPEPREMRGAVEAGDGLLRGDAANVSAVVARTETECRSRHRLLLEAMRAVCPYPLDGVTVLRGGPRPGDPGWPGRETVVAAFDRGRRLGAAPIDVLGDGELRYLAMAAVLLTGPGVLAVDAAEVPDALQLLTVLAEDVDRGLDRRQVGELMALAGRMTARGHVRLVATAHERSWVEADGGAGGAGGGAAGGDGVEIVELPGRTMG